MTLWLFQMNDACCENKIHALTHTHSLQIYYIRDANDTKYCGAHARSLHIVPLKMKISTIESHLIQNKQNENNKPYINIICPCCCCCCVSQRLQMIWCVEVDRFMVAADEEINRLKCLRFVAVVIFSVTLARRCQCRGGGVVCTRSNCVQTNESLANRIRLIQKHICALPRLQLFANNTQNVWQTQTQPIFYFCVIFFSSSFFYFHCVGTQFFLITYQIMPSSFDCQDDARFSSFFSFLIYYHYVHLIIRQTKPLAERLLLLLFSHEICIRRCRLYRNATIKEKCVKMKFQ